MRTSFFTILFVVAIVASRIKFGAAETNPSGRVHAKDDDTAYHLKTADAQDNSTDIKEERGNMPENKVTIPVDRPTTSVDEATMKKANVFMAPNEMSTKFKKKNVETLATYATSDRGKVRAMNMIINAYGIFIVVILILAYILFGYRPFTN